MADRLLRRWETLHVGVQTAVAVVVSVTFMFLLHLGPFNQPLGRALSYAGFWGLLMAGGIMVATRAEAAKRRSGERRDDQ